MNLQENIIRIREMMGLNENVNNLEFSEEQKEKAQQLFKETFNLYLKKVSNDYPMIYHCTTINNYESIKEDGLTSERNYFLEYDNDLNDYVSGEPGIACGVNFKDVIDRLYPDPEWLIEIIKTTGNPEFFDKKNIDERVLFCLWITKILNLNLNSNTHISDEKMEYMLDNNTFAWVYVKGTIPPSLIEIEVHSDLL
jgi:hypothetical protein